MPTPITKATTSSLTSTMAVLKVALSLIPITSTQVTSAAITTPGRSKYAPVVKNWPVVGS